MSGQLPGASAPDLDHIGGAVPRGPSAPAEPLECRCWRARHGLMGPHRDHVSEFRRALLEQRIAGELGLVFAEQRP